MSLQSRSWFIPQTSLLLFLLLSREEAANWDCCYHIVWWSITVEQLVFAIQLISSMATNPAHWKSLLLLQPPSKGSDLDLVLIPAVLQFCVSDYPRDCHSSIVLLQALYSWDITLQLSIPSIAEVYHSNSPPLIIHNFLNPPFTLGVLTK